MLQESTLILSYTCVCARIRHTQKCKHVCQAKIYEEESVCVCERERRVWYLLERVEGTWNQLSPIHA